MKRFKKILSFALIFLLTVTLSSCKDLKNNSNNKINSNEVSQSFSSEEKSKKLAAENITVIDKKRAKKFDKKPRMK